MLRSLLLLEWPIVRAERSQRESILALDIACRIVAERKAYRVRCGYLFGNVNNYFVAVNLSLGGVENSILAGNLKAQNCLVRWSEQIHARSE